MSVSCLLEASLLLVPFVSDGFERLHAALHVPLKHLPVLPLLLAQRHEVTAVVGLILDTTFKGFNTFSVLSSDLLLLLYSAFGPPVTSLMIPGTSLRIPGLSSRNLKPLNSLK